MLRYILFTAENGVLTYFMIGPYSTATKLMGSISDLITGGIGADVTAGTEYCKQSIFQSGRPIMPNPKFA